MSRHDFLTRDTEPDSETEARRARIEQIAENYRNGKDLFIMSAALKGELKTNPWAKKRKRDMVENSLSNIFGIKKAIYTAGAKKSPEILRSVPSTKSSGQAHSESLFPERGTPFWDNTASAGEALSKAPLPVARIINFHDYDSQAPGELIPRRRPLSSPAVRPLGVVKLNQKKASRLGAPEKAAHVLHHTQCDCNREAQVSESALPIDIATASQDSSVSKRSGTSSTSRRPAAADCSQVAVVVATITGNDGRPLSPIHPVQNNVRYPDSSGHVDSNLEHGLSPVKQVIAQHLSQSSLPLLQDLPGQPGTQVFRNTSMKTPPIQEQSEDHALDTQAELARAQEGLADAFNFTADETIVPNDVFEAQVLRSADECPVLSTVSDGNPHEVRERVPPTSPSGRATTLSPSGIVLRPATPTSRVQAAQVPQSFANFQSPSGTQDIFMSFGSPLTFSPERTADRSGGRRQDDTIGDIQRYLNASNWSAEEEAKRLMEE